MEALSFRTSYEYDMNQIGITLPIALRLGEMQVELQAKVDTGASDCIFARGHGELLGLTIEHGTPKYFGTATGQFKTYGHTVMLSVLGDDFDSLVYLRKAPVIIVMF